MIGLEDQVTSWEIRIVLSILIAGLAIGLAALVNRIRRHLTDRFPPVILDLVNAVLMLAILIGGVLAIVDLWGLTDTVREQTEFLRIEDRLPEIVVTVVILVSVYVLGGVITRLLDDLSVESGVLTEHQREVGVRLTQISLWLLGGIVILGLWEIDLTGLLVGAGFAGIVLGMAARKTLGSLIAGFVLMFSRPFEVGDWVEVDGYQGTVTDITMMSTRIRALSGEYVVVPNDVVSNEIVVNRTRNDRFRIEVEVGIDYEADIDEASRIARDQAEQLAKDSEVVMSRPEPSVRIRRFDDSAILLTVRAWVERPTPRRVSRSTGQLIEHLKVAFDDAGIGIPYPQRELSTREDGFAISLTDDKRSVNTDDRVEENSSQ